MVEPEEEQAEASTSANDERRETRSSPRKVQAEAKQMASNKPKSCKERGISERDRPAMSKVSFHQTISLYTERGMWWETNLLGNFVMKRDSPAIVVNEANVL